jgi:hypothetical protein
MNTDLQYALGQLERARNWSWSHNAQDAIDQAIDAIERYAYSRALFERLMSQPGRRFDTEKLTFCGE